ncbi:hypothetical protein Tco_0251682 [Tanacetum coccineum]
MPQSSKQLLTSYQLVHVNRQYEIAKANKKVDLINLPCPAASKIIGEILQQFKFTIDEEEVTFSLNDLCIMLKLPQATANNHVGFVEAPDLGTMIKFLIILGHVVAIHLAGQFYTKDLPQPLQTLGKVLMRCLTSSIMSIDQPPLAIMKMFYCIINNVYVDYVALIWEGTHRTNSAPRSPNLQNTLKKKKESGTRELSVPKNPLKIKIRRRQSDPKAPILTVEQIDLDNMTMAQLLSYTLAKSTQEAYAQVNVKLVEQHLLDEDVNKIVEGDNAIDDEFTDTVLLS